MNLAALSDEELIERARTLDAGGAAPLLDVLYERYYRKVSYWCLRICGERDLASDLAQEVFLRVHDRLGTFRLESRFSTWLYQVTRSVAINKGMAAQRRRADASIDEDDWREPVDPKPDAVSDLEGREIVARFQQAIARDLEPLEAKVLHLHFVDGLTVKGITELLALDNKSGAKAYLVSAKRKLTRRFGRWLESHEKGTGGRS